jgi:hypothetical protein
MESTIKIVRKKKKKKKSTPSRQVLTIEKRLMRMMKWLKCSKKKKHLRKKINQNGKNLRK